MARVIDPDYQGEMGLLLHNGGEEEYVCNAGDPLECLLVLPYPVIVCAKLQPSSGRTTIGTDSLRNGLGHPTRLRTTTS